jgi:competence protein ComEC
MDCRDTRRCAGTVEQGMLVAVSAGLVTGVCTQLLWPVMPLAWMLVLSAVMLVIPVWLASAGRRTTAACAVGLALGMAMAALQGDRVLDARLPAALEGEDFLVIAQILSVQQHADGGQLLRVSVSTLPWNADVRSWPAWQLRVTSRHPVAALPGETWQMAVRLKRPRASQNPGVADFERYLFGERVVATGYLRENDAFQRIAPAAGWSALRQTLLLHALPLMGDGPGDIADSDAERFARAVLPALVLDERGLLSSAQWRVLADTGTAHLVAISGLHVALLWGALLWIAGVLLQRRSDTLRYRAAAVLPALLMAVAYAALAGMPLPALRAAVMLAVASAFLLASGQVPVWRVLLASAAVVLLLDPLSVHASGFWLSFGAVGLLLLLNDLHRRPAVSSAAPRWVQVAVSGMRMQVALSLLLAPMLVGLFGSASVSSVIANIPAIPLVNLFALPPALAGFFLAPVWPSGADVLLDSATAILELLWGILVRIDTLPWLAPLQAHSAGPVHVLLMMALLPVILFAGALPLRMAAVLAAALAWPAAAPVAYGAAQACVLDVGQGLAVLVRTASHAVLYDAGPAWGERDAGASTVVPAARSLGVDDLDLLVVSHDDLDHAGGAASVRSALEPALILLGDARSKVRLGNVGEQCSEVRRFQYDAVNVTVFPGVSSGNDNDRSCVMHVSAGGQSLLVPGDSSRRREIALLEDYGNALAADVLVAGHHGSRSATAPTFLYRVAPAQVIFSAAHKSRFGHPHPQVTAMIARQGIAMHGTALSGAICFLLGAGSPPEPHGWRTGMQRFWHR